MEVGPRPIRDIIHSFSLHSCHRPNEHYMITNYITNNTIPSTPYIYIYIYTHTYKYIYIGLNSMVLASNSEAVLLPVNEPTYGTKRKSQIQTYLEQNGGAGEFNKMRMRLEMDMFVSPSGRLCVCLDGRGDMLATQPTIHTHMRAAHRLQDGRQRFTHAPPPPKTIKAHIHT